MTEDPLLQVEDLRVEFVSRDAWGRRRRVVQAVRGVNLEVRRGETLGLVGESGCGKSTLARSVVRLIQPSAGRIQVAGEDWTHPPERWLRPRRTRMQMVFQDPFSSLNPRMRVGEALLEPLQIHRRGTPAERPGLVARMLEQVGLHPDDAKRYPHEFSGGQRQRIGIARALILEPDLLVADEAVSALDVSIQAQILNLLADLQRDRGFAMLFISHDLRVVDQVCDRVAVMYLGRIVEQGPPSRVFEQPRHPYTQALLSAVPQPDPEDRRERILLQGEPPDPAAPPPGCAFAPRCPRARERCHRDDPRLQDDSHPDPAACWFPLG